MTNHKASALVWKQQSDDLHRPKLASFLYPDAVDVNVQADEYINECTSNQKSSASSVTSSHRGTRTLTSGEASSCFMYPWNNHPVSPYKKSPWIVNDAVLSSDGLIGSIAREEGPVYSLAASGDLLYTGTDSKNVRVWKNLKDVSGFKSTSGFVKAIVISGDKIFTGHQDGKIRIWKISSKNPEVHKRIGSLPSFKDYVKSSLNPKKHYDAVSCLSLDVERGLLYSGSWDRTLKVWRISDSKCLESIRAHDDAINSVVAGFGCLVFTGSADLTVKVWRREMQGDYKTRHFLDQVLLKPENAVTALAVNDETGVAYCGSSDGLVNFWEREKHHLGHGGALRGHKMAVLCLATAGNSVFSGSSDKNICVWRREPSGAHSCLSVLSGHTAPVKCLAVEEDQGDGDDRYDSSHDHDHDRRWIVYSGSLDKSVKVWRVSERVPDLSGFYSPAQIMTS